MISFSVRLVLGTLLMFAFHKFQKAVNLQFGPTVAAWLLIITASQFHLMFYVSRPLPNIFALFLGNNITFKLSFITKRKLFIIEKSIYVIFFFFNEFSLNQNALIARITKFFSFTLAMKCAQCYIGIIFWNSLIVRYHWQLR